MIDFAIIGLPRSGTAWLANLFTADGVLCCHDPIGEMGFDELGNVRIPGYVCGIADTSLSVFPHLVDRLECPIIKVVRDVECINASLADCGIEHRYTGADEMRLSHLPGLLLRYDDIHNYHLVNAAYRYATGKTLDQRRFELLCKLNIQRHPASITPDYSIIQRIIEDHA